tara:strand:- start:266 stop:1309 length:1044 start_codon:yes stop_codon:yes gene_type:complete
MGNTPTDTALTYISFVLSVISLTLFVISGFQVNHESTRDQEAVSTSYVWMYNTSTNIARVRDGVSAVCVGFTDEECALAASSGPDHAPGVATVRIKEAIQLGEKVFRVMDNGATLQVTQGSEQILRVDLTTGATVVGYGGQEQMPKKGTRIVGHPSDGRDDSEMWQALSKVDLYMPDADMPSATLSTVQHRQDGSLKGVRIARTAESVEAGGRGFVATDFGLIVGDPTINFINSNKNGADVLVFGSTFCGNTRGVQEPPSCTSMPLSSLDMENRTFHQLLKVQVDSCSRPDYIQGAEVIDYGEQGFVGCLSGWVFWNSGQEQLELGKCYETQKGKFVYYCRVSHSLA